MSEGMAERRKAVALRGKARRWLCGGRHSGGDAGKSTVTAMDGNARAMIGTAKAVIGEARALQGLAQAKGMHRIEWQRKGAGLICGAWAKHRSATQSEGVALLGVGMAWRRVARA